MCGIKCLMKYNLTTRVHIWEPLCTIVIRYEICADVNSHLRKNHAFHWTSHRRTLSRYEALIRYSRVSTPHQTHSIADDEACTRDTSEYRRRYFTLSECWIRSSTLPSPFSRKRKSHRARASSSRGNSFALSNSYAFDRFDPIVPVSRSPLILVTPVNVSNCINNFAPTQVIRAEKYRLITKAVHWTE